MRRYINFFYRRKKLTFRSKRTPSPTSLLVVLRLRKTSPPTVPPPPLRIWLENVSFSYSYTAGEYLTKSIRKKAATVRMATTPTIIIMISILDRGFISLRVYPFKLIKLLAPSSLMNFRSTLPPTTTYSVCVVCTPFKFNTEVRSSILS